MVFYLFALFLLGVLGDSALCFRLHSQNFTSKDGTRIYAEATGSPSNPPLLWIHGDSFSGLVFEKQFGDEQLLDSFYMVRMDLRGMGRSAKPVNSADVDAWTPERHAADVQAVIDGFALHKPILLGWSYGGTSLFLHKIRCDLITIPPSSSIYYCRLYRSIRCRRVIWCCGH